MRDANIAQIRDDMGDPSWLVARTWNGTIFDGHPYARPGFGTIESMHAIERDDLLDFIHAQFAKNVLKVAIAGDIRADEAAKLVDMTFGALPEKAKEIKTENAKLMHPGKTILLPLDTPQTFISAGEEGMDLHDPDWQAAVVMNQILGGGGFDARLMKEIREKRGLTYGVYSNLSSMKHAALIQASLSAGNEKAADALRLLRREWGKMAAAGATEEEVNDAKAYLTGSLLLDLTSTDDISETLNGLQQEDLGAQYINERNALIEAVTPEDVGRVAARLLKTENLTVILVGQPLNITADIMLDHPPGMNVPKEKQ